MFDELKNAVKAQLYEKAISPLSGAFILSWVVWNYRFILVLISSSSYSEKISYIDKLPISEQTFLYGAFLPLLSASAFIVVYPIPAKFFYEISRKWQKELKEMQQKYDDELPMDQEEARKIRREILQAEIEFDKELKNKEDEISRLKEIIVKLEEKMPVSAEREEEPRLNGMQYDMLSIVANLPGGILQSALLSHFTSIPDSNAVIAAHCLDELINMNLLQTKEGGHPANDRWYVATKQGRAFLVKNRRPSELEVA